MKVISTIHGVRNGVLKIDGALIDETEAKGQTRSIEVEPTFYLGNLLPETLQLEVVQRNLQVIKHGYIYFLFI